MIWSDLTIEIVDRWKLSNVSLPSEAVLVVLLMWPLWKIWYPFSPASTFCSLSYPLFDDFHEIIRELFCLSKRSPTNPVAGCALLYLLTLGGGGG